MKKRLLKVRIIREQSNGRTTYIYPKEYDPTRFQVLCYETQLTDKLQEVVDRGNNYEFVLGFVEAQYVDQFLQSPSIIQINRAEAEGFVAKDLHKTVERVTDVNKVLLVLAKQARGEKLNLKEQDVINPTTQETGITKTKSYHNILDDHGI